MRELIQCPMCKGHLEYKESSFKQYEQDSYKCNTCMVELTIDFVKGYITGLNDDRPKRSYGVKDG